MTNRYKYDHDCPFEAFITNLGKYNEGELVGEWVKFPTSQEHLQEVFKRIGIGSTDEFGQPYEEWFITDYDVYVEGLYGVFGEYENLDSLNELAEAIEGFEDLEKLYAVLDLESFNSIKDVMELINDMDDFVFYPGLKCEWDLGYFLVNESGLVDTRKLGEFADYIDYEKYGDDVATRDSGLFTDSGYISRR